VSTLNVDSGTYGVQSISYSPAGDMIAAGCYNGKIHILDTDTVAVQRSLNGHLNCIKSVTWNNDGTKLASGSLDHTVRIWSVGSAGTFESKSTLSGHSDYVRAVSWCPDRTMLASGSDDKTIKLWDTQSGKVISTLGHRYTLFLCFDTNNFPNRCTFLE
jgi:WD40 repeat protein